MLIILAVCLCASLAACSYLYATHQANTRLIRRQDKQGARLERRCAALLDKVLQRNGVGPISQPNESVPAARSFVPSDPWQEHWEDLDLMDEEKKVAQQVGVLVSELSEEQKEELKRRAARAVREG